MMRRPFPFPFPFPFTLLLFLCVFIKTAHCRAIRPSRFLLLKFICHSHWCVYLCACINYIAYLLVVQPCHPSHFMSLALILLGEIRKYLLRKPLIKRDTEDTLSLLLYRFYSSPEFLLIPSLLSLYFLDYLGCLLLNQHFLVYVIFSVRPSIPRFPHRVYNSFGVCSASLQLLRPPLIMSCVFFKLHKTTQPDPVTLAIICPSH